MKGFALYHALEEDKNKENLSKNKNKLSKRAKLLSYKDKRTKRQTIKQSNRRTNAEKYY